MPVSTHAEPTKCAQNKWIKWSQWRSRGAIIHCCPYKKMMCVVEWTDEFHSDLCSPAGQPSWEVRGLSFSVDLSYVSACVEHMQGAALWKCSRSQEDTGNTTQVLYNNRFYDLICYPAIFWTPLFLFDKQECSFFNLLLSSCNEINCFIVFIKVWTRCEIKGTSMVLQQKPLWKWRHTNAERQKIPSSPIFPLFQSTLG